MWRWQGTSQPQVGHEVVLRGVKQKMTGVEEEGAALRTGSQHCYAYYRRQSQKQKQQLATRPTCRNCQLTSLWRSMVQRMVCVPWAR